MNIRRGAKRGERVLCGGETGDIRIKREDKP